MKIVNFGGWRRIEFSDNCYLLLNAPGRWKYHKHSYELFGREHTTYMFGPLQLIIKRSNA